MKTKAFYSAAAAVFAAGLATGSSSFSITLGGMEVGELGSSSNFQKVITIGPNTKWVNVKQGDNVKFVDQQSGQSFVWSFQMHGAQHFDLSAVAPADMLTGQRIEAYVDEKKASDGLDSSGD